MPPVTGLREGARVEGVRKIAVLRANALGDLMFSLPALGALAATYPEAEVVLLGAPWHRDFLSALEPARLLARLSGAPLAVLHPAATDPECGTHIERDFCPHEVSFVADVDPERVAAVALELTGRGTPDPAALAHGLDPRAHW